MSRSGKQRKRRKKAKQERRSSRFRARLQRLVTHASCDTCTLSKCEASGTDNGTYWEVFRCGNCGYKWKLAEGRLHDPVFGSFALPLDLISLLGVIGAKS